MGRTSAELLNSANMNAKSSFLTPDPPFTASSLVGLQTGFLQAKAFSVYAKIKLLRRGRFKHQTVLVKINL